MINKLLTKDDAIHLLHADIPAKYRASVLQRIVEIDPVLFARLSSEQIAEFPVSVLKTVFSKFPYSITLIPDELKLEVLTSQDTSFYTKDVLRSLHDIEISGHIYNQLFGHIELYTTFDSYGMRIKGYTIESRADNYGLPDGSGIYHIPENAYTWNPSLLLTGQIRMSIQWFGTQFRTILRLKYVH
jgi:hypothetical protein